jgi:hypothetical protein
LLLHQSNDWFYCFLLSLFLVLESFVSFLNSLLGLSIHFFFLFFKISHVKACYALLVFPILAYFLFIFLFVWFYVAIYFTLRVFFHYA